MFDIISCLLVNLYVLIAMTSPNEFNELGSDKDDKIHEKVQYRNYILNKFSAITFTLTYSLIKVKYNAFSLIDILYFTMCTLCIFLRLYSYMTLGHFFTFTLGTRKDHKIIKTGPYKYLIHPSYTGQVGCLLFAGFFTGIYLIFLIPIIIYMVDRVRKRIAKEENMMITNFGDEYKNYIILTKYRLIPYIY